MLHITERAKDECHHHPVINARKFRRLDVLRCKIQIQNCTDSGQKRLIPAQNAITPDGKKRLHKHPHKAHKNKSTIQISGDALINPYKRGIQKSRHLMRFPKINEHPLTTGDPDRHGKCIGFINIRTHIYTLPYSDQ